MKYIHLSTNKMPYEGFGHLPKSPTIIVPADPHFREKIDNDDGNSSDD